MPLVYDDQDTKTEQNTDRDSIRGLEDSFRAGDAEYPAGHPSAKKDDILGKEDATGSSGDSLYSPANSGSASGRFNVRNLTPLQKKGGLAGILIGLVLAALTTVSLGPLQFIHFAQMLQGFHFSDQEVEGNSRVKKLLIYAKTGDTNKTRLGFIANAQANNIDKKFKANGWAATPSNTGKFNGFDYDPVADKNKKPSPEEINKAKEIHAKLASEGVRVGEFDKTTGKFNVPADGMKYWANLSLIKIIYSGNRDVGIITAAYQKRILIKRAGISFNPITKLETATKEEGVKKFKEARSKLLTGAPNPNVPIAGTPTGENPTEEEKQKAASSQSAADEATKYSNEAKGGKLKAASLSGAGAVGFICVAKTIADESSKASQINRIIPLVQVASEVISVGSKVMAGDDVDSEALGIINESMSSKEGGSFSGASSIQYEEGKSGGKKLQPELDPNGGTNSVSEQLGKIRGLDTACTVLNNTVVSVAIGAVTGSLITTVIQEVAAATPAGRAFFEKIIGLFTTSVVDLSQPQYAGAVFGEAANVGARLIANETSASMGGLPLSNAQELALNDSVKRDKISEDKTKSIAAKYLNPYDYKTPVAKTLNKIHTENISSTVAAIPKNMFASLTNIVTKRTLAVNDTPPSDVYYGIRKVGFAAGSLDKIENPYTNASEAYDILKGPRGEGYVKRLKTCNKVDVTFNDGRLDFVSEAGTSETPAIMGTYSAEGLENCKEDSDSEFLKVRAAAFDTITMKSFSCIEFDDKVSCSDISGNTASSSGVSSGANCTTKGITAPLEDYSKTEYGGSTLNKRTLDMVKAAENIYGGKITISHGSYNTGGVAASAGTHGGGGALDVGASSLSNEERQKIVKSLRQAGFAAWLRTPAQANWGYHIHAIAIGDKELSSGAQSQVKDYFNGLNGLSGDGKDNHLDIGRPIPEWATKFGSPLCPS